MKYKVNLFRREGATVIVDAESADEARELAMDEDDMGMVEWDTYDTEIESVSEIEES